MSQEVCDAVVEWLLTHKIVTSERPWMKGGNGVNGEERGKLLALEEMKKQDRERYKALAIVGGTLNSLEKQHLDGHRADGFIKVLSIPTPIVKTIKQLKMRRGIELYYPVAA